MKEMAEKQNRLLELEQSKVEEEKKEEGEIRFMKKKIEQVENRERKLEGMMESEKKEMELNSIIENNTKSASDGMEQLDKDLGIVLNNNQQIRFRKTIDPRK